MKKIESPATPQMDVQGTVATQACPILLAVDFSEDSEAALNWACEFAEATGAPLEILHVVHDPAASPGSYKADQTDPLEPIAEVARRKLDGLLTRLGRDNPGRPALGDAVVHCVSGLPAPKILDVARTRGARLLVLGGGRKNGLERFLHGSTAHQVARKAQLPVTIIKADNQ